MKRYKTRRLSAKEWDALLARSPQRTRFLDPDFLKLFDVPLRYWGIDRNGVVIAGMPVIETDIYGGRSLPWCYYQGIIYHEEIWRAAPSKRTQYEIELAEQLVEDVAQEEPAFTISLHSSLTDIRGLDWVHFHRPDRPCLKLFPRYTAIVDLVDASPETLRAACRSARRQEERYAVEREGLTVAEDGTIQELVALFQATFVRQGISLRDETVSALPDFAGYLLKNGCGRLHVVRKDANAVAIALVFDDYDGTAHVPVVGTGETRFGGTLLYFHILFSALERGAKAVDLNGANSPKRAYFKHSMGAAPQLFFEASWKGEEE